MTEKEQHAASPEHDLVEGPPAESGPPWWRQLSRRLGGATRALVDGAGQVTGLLKSSRRAPAPALPAPPELDESLQQLAGKVVGRGVEGAATLADDQEFWVLVGRIHRMRGLAQRRLRLLKSGPAEPAEAPAAEPAAPPSVEPGAPAQPAPAAEPAPAAAPDDFLAGVLTDGESQDAAAQSEQGAESEGESSDDSDKSNQDGAPGKARHPNVKKRS